MNKSCIKLVASRSKACSQPCCVLHLFSLTPKAIQFHIPPLFSANSQTRVSINNVALSQLWYTFQYEDWFFWVKLYPPYLYLFTIYSIYSCQNSYKKGRFLWPHYSLMTWWSHGMDQSEIPLWLMARTRYFRQNIEVYKNFENKLEIYKQITKKIDSKSILILN